jgi:hypothetical protein
MFINFAERMKHLQSNLAILQPARFPLSLSSCAAVESVIFVFHSDCLREGVTLQQKWSELQKQSGFIFPSHVKLTQQLLPFIM